MRKYLLSSAALVGLLSAPATAADLPVKAPIRPAAVSVVNWTGFYIGGNIGVAWLDKTVTEGNPPVENPTGSSFSLSKSGVTGGAQAGYNWQVTNWVYGVEADFNWTDINRFNLGLQPPGGADDFFQGKVEWFATFRARLGHSFGPWLPYITGGGALARLTNGYGDTFNFVPDFDSVIVRKTRLGWTAGGGLEYRLASAWSAKLEYLYLDFGSFDASPAPPFPGFAVVTFEDRMHVVRAGLNYRFGGN